MSSLPSAPIKPPLWRDIRVLRWAFQLLVLALVVAFVYWLYGNYQANVARSSIPTDLRFLDNPANFTMPGNDLDQSQPVRDAFVQGFYNTLRVAIVGILLTTVLGTMVGIARLSKNFMVRTFAAAYVELVRNIPLLLLLTFMNLAVVLQTFPRIENAWLPLNLFVISNRGIAIPWFTGSGGVLLVVLASALVVTWIVVKIRGRVSDVNGKPARGLAWGTPAFIVVMVAGWIVLGYDWVLPFVDDRSTSGGLRLDPSFFALLVTLVVYTSSHVAEIVRGSIQAVAKGQAEAADALALSGGQKMRLVILPQAFRIAMPALGNQFLNLIKNSSLGATISYFELTQVAQITVGNGSPAVPAFTLTLLVYLVISLVTSVIVNIVNRR
ncbi:MAG: general L-amino acid transport system permease protein, partial [Pontimonas sp.]